MADGPTGAFRQLPQARRGEFLLVVELKEGRIFLGVGPPGFIRKAIKSLK